MVCRLAEQPAAGSRFEYWERFMSTDARSRQDSGEFRDMDSIRALLHDLRQPLAAIALLAEPSGDVRRRMDAIQEQVSWLASVVETTLEQSAHDRFVQADIAQVAAEACERARVGTQTEVLMRVIGDPLAWARPVALGRALGCLLDNAIRAAGPGGQVVLVVEGMGTDVVLRVIDDGPGLGRIESRTSLGLTTTRALVAACQGSFGLEAGPLRGTVAEIRLAGSIRAQLVR